MFDSPHKLFLSAPEAFRPTLLKAAAVELLKDEDLLRVVRRALPASAQGPFDELLSALREWK